MTRFKGNATPADSGSLDDIGEGPGEGFNINIPLPPGSGDGAYMAAMDRVIAPALTAFKPHLIVVPSGFDAGGLDPMGRMLLSSSTYVAMTKVLKRLAADLCDNRLLFVHEGGYSAVHAPFCAHAVIEELCDAPTRIDDPFDPVLLGMAGQNLARHQTEITEKVAKVAVGLR